MRNKMTLLLWWLTFSFLNLSANIETVVINGKFLDVKYPSVSLLYYDIIKQDIKYIYTATVDSNSGDFTMFFKIDRPVFCKFYEDFFYVTPGDSVRIDIATDTTVSKGYKLIITGHNASHYTFSNYLRSHSKKNIDRSIKNYTGNWVTFQKECWEYYDERKTLLNAFLKEYKYTDDFKKYWTQEIFSDYLLNLLQPLYQPKNTNLSHVEEYLEKINVDSIFKEDDLYGHQSFRQFCGDYIKFIIEKKFASSSGDEGLRKTYQFVLAHYTKRAKEYFVCSIYNRCILLKNQPLTNLIKEISALSLDYFEDIEIKNRIKSTYSVISNTNKVLPDSLMEVKIYNESGKVLELKEVLFSLRGRYILIDNCASWCIPCINEIDIANNSAIHEKMKKNELEILYLSQDKNISKWNTFHVEKKLPVTNSFLFVNVPNYFMNFFMINKIPRYILLGKNGELIDYDAPRLSDFDSLLRLLK